MAHQQAHTLVLLCNGSDDLFGSVAAVVIDNQYLVADAKRIQHRADMIQKTSDVFSLTQCRNRQRQLLRVDLSCSRRCKRTSVAGPSNGMYDGSITADDILTSSIRDRICQDANS